MRTMSCSSILYWRKIEDYDKERANKLLSSIRDNKAIRKSFSNLEL